MLGWHLGRGKAKSYRTVEQFTRDLASRPSTATSRDGPQAPAAIDQPRRSGRRKLGYREQQEFDGMEAAIMDAEADVERLEAHSSDPATTSDHRKSADAFAALDAAQRRVKDLYARWSELDAIRRGDAGN